VELGQIRREGDRFFFPSVTDLSEPEHCVELVGAYIFCTCRGYIEHRKDCRHAKRVREYVNATEERALIPSGPTALPEVWRSPLDLERRLADLAAERNIIANFVQTAMVKGEDYGVIPGTKLPSLYKAGAEKLCEMYGLFPRIVDKAEQSDPETGHCRYVITVGLFDRASGVQVAECPGECSTREAKYMYRWVGDRDPTIRAMSAEARASLKSRTMRSGNGEYTQWRLENDDLHSLWNTVLKMSFKRAYVGATHQATRSSGLFTLTETQLDEFAMEGEFRYLDPEDADPLEGDFTPVEDVAPPTPPPPAQKAPESAPARRTSAPRRQPGTKAAEQEEWEKTDAFKKAQVEQQAAVARASAPSDSQNAQKALNLFWQAAYKVEKSPDAIIDAAKEHFGKAIVDLTPGQRGDLLHWLEHKVWRDVEQAAADVAPAPEHTAVPSYTAEGVMVCEVCEQPCDPETGDHK
jgi:hypothetical protein